MKNLNLFVALFFIFSILAVSLITMAVITSAQSSQSLQNLQIPRTDSISEIISESISDSSQSLSDSTSSPIYYADLSLIVQDDGSVIIVGTTNDADFSDGLHQKFTSKKGEYWLLNLSSSKNYSDYIISIKLPKGTEFNYLKTEGRSRISYDDGIRVIASGTGTLSVLIQYKIVSKEKSYAIPLIIFILLITFVLVLLYFRNNENKKQKVQKENKRDFESKNKNFELEKKDTRIVSDVKNNFNNEKIEVLKQTLTDNQFQILQLLMDAEGKLTQKQLQHRSGMAKATLSRNVELLSKKNIVIKQSRGLTNMIIINKEMIE